MNNSVSLTIPIESGALGAAITMLLQLKDGCEPMNPLTKVEVHELLEHSQKVAQLHDQDNGPGKILEQDAIARLKAERTVTDVANQEAEPKVAAINPSVAFGGSVPPPPVADTPMPVKVSDHVELDSAGMPWDSRIHSSAKSKVTNGTWKLLRGVDAELVKAVKAEYLGNAGSTPTQNSEPTVKQADVPTNSGTVPPPPSVPAAPVSGGMTYEQAIEHLISVKKVPTYLIQQRCSANGLPTFALLQDAVNAHLIPIIVAEAIEANEKRLLEAGTSNG